MSGGCHAGREAEQPGRKAWEQDSHDAFSYINRLNRHRIIDLMSCFLFSASTAPSSSSRLVVFSDESRTIIKSDTMPVNQIDICEDEFPRNPRPHM